MSPVKTKTQTIAQPTELTAAPVATLLQHSQDGLDTLNEADQHLQTAYAELAQETLPLDAESRRRHESLREEITVLKNATENYKKCYNTASAMTDELQTRLHDTERSQKKGIVPKPPANATIDFAERKQDHFAQGLNFYKLFLICFFGRRYRRITLVSAAEWISGKSVGLGLWTIQLALWSRGNCPDAGTLSVPESKQLDFFLRWIFGWQCGRVCLFMGAGDDFRLLLLGLQQYAV